MTTIPCEDEKSRLSSKNGIYYTVNTVTAEFFHEAMTEINKTGDKLMLVTV